MAFQGDTIPKKKPFQKLKVRHLILWGVLIIFLLGFFFGIIAATTDLNVEDQILVHTLSILILSLLSVWAILRCKRLHISTNQLIGNLPSHYRWLPIIGIVIAILVFSSGIFLLSYSLLSLLAPSFVEEILNEQIFCSASETSAPVLCNSLAIIAIVIVAPVTEEFLFRGIILHRWATKWGLKPAILGSSLLFGVLHRNIIGIFVFALVMALLYIKTRTLIVPIIAHALNNFAAVVLELISINSNSAETVYTLDQLRSQWWLGVLYIVVSAPWLILFLYKNWPRNKRYLPYFANGLR